MKQLQSIYLCNIQSSGLFSIWVPKGEILDAVIGGSDGVEIIVMEDAGDSFLEKKFLVTGVFMSIPEGDWRYLNSLYAEESEMPVVVFVEDE